MHFLQEFLLSKSLYTLSNNTKQLNMLHHQMAQYLPDSAFIRHSIYVSLIHDLPHDKNISPHSLNVTCTLQDIQLHKPS